MAHTQYVVFRDQGQWQSSQMACITGRTRHRETLSVLPWTLHTRRAERALTAKSCFRINSGSSGLTEKTRIRRIAQTTLNPNAEKPAIGSGFLAVGFEPERLCWLPLAHSRYGQCADECLL